jgi:superfamily II DNA or RNA helicase
MWLSLTSLCLVSLSLSPRSVPGEMKSFSDFDFPEVIRQNIELSKYVKPTPIQKFALPVAFLGRDLMACAQTGSGKSVTRAQIHARTRACATLSPSLTSLKALPSMLST